MAFIANWAVDKVKTTASGYLATGLKAGGTMAGNAVGGVGTLIENGGRSVGEGTVAGGIKGVGGTINGYGNGITGSFAADGPVGGGAAKKTAVVKSSAQPSTKNRITDLGDVDPKALGARKALPAAGTAKPRPVAGAAKPPAAGRPAPALAGAAAKPVGTGARPKPQSNAAAKPVPDGKVRISAASRPKPVVK
ncbi:hypothetical protein LTR53_003839 [Teratosphaeriaceae sp. CCFEE 6253]|nr:hypothetical protein LTR53_003839 [Teratosphaeriaceae sp. CCFEE 6253]